MLRRIGAEVGRYAAGVFVQFEGAEGPTELVDMLEGMTFERLATAEAACRELARAAPSRGYNKTWLNIIPKALGLPVGRLRLDLQFLDTTARWTLDKPRDGFGWKLLRGYPRTGPVSEHDLSLLDRIKTWIDAHQVDINAWGRVYNASHLPRPAPELVASIHTHDLVRDLVGRLPRDGEAAREVRQLSMRLEKRLRRAS